MDMQHASKKRITFLSLRYLTLYLFLVYIVISFTVKSKWGYFNVFILMGVVMAKAAR